MAAGMELVVVALARGAVVGAGLPCGWEGLPDGGFCEGDGMVTRRGGTRSASVTVTRRARRCFGEYSRVSAKRERK